MLDYFEKTTSFLLLLNGILYSISFFKFGKPFKYFTLFILGHFLVEYGMRYVALSKSNNHFLSHFYFLCQFLFLSLFFHQLIQDKLTQKIIVVYLMSCLLFLTIYFSIQPELLLEFNILEIFLTSFPLIIYAIIYLFEMLTGKKEFYIITISLVVYLFGSTIIFLFSNIIHNYDLGVIKYCWALNTVLYFIFQVVLLLSWKKHFSKKINYV